LSYILCISFHYSMYFIVSEVLVSKTGRLATARQAADRWAACRGQATGRQVSG
jgi:hypothetical protein